MVEIVLKVLNVEIFDDYIIKYLTSSLTIISLYFYRLPAVEITYYTIRNAINSFWVCYIILDIIIAFGIWQNFKRPDQNLPKNLLHFLL